MLRMADSDYSYHFELRAVGLVKGRLIAGKKTGTLMHLTQFNAKERPYGMGTDIHALSRVAPEFIDESLSYLVVPKGSRKTWTWKHAKIAHELALEALRQRSNGLRRYPKWWEAFITELKRLVELSAELNERPHFFPLVSSIKIIADVNDYEKLKTALKSRYSLKPRLNTSKITIHLSDEAERSPGIAAYITDLLYSNGINILDAFLGYEEIILILDESDGPRAYTTLEEERGKARK